jgi:putative ABC transport system ATP-binding protein
LSAWPATPGTGQASSPAASSSAWPSPARSRLLLADEPTGQLDAETGKQIMRLIRSVVRSEGVTALLATHDPTLMDIADSILHLTDGAIVRESQGEQVSGRCPGSRSLLG